MWIASKTFIRITPTFNHMSCGLMEYVSEDVNTFLLCFGAIIKLFAYAKYLRFGTLGVFASMCWKVFTADTVVMLLNKVTMEICQ